MASGAMEHMRGLLARQSSLRCVFVYSSFTEAQGQDLPPLPLSLSLSLFLPSFHFSSQFLILQHHRESGCLACVADLLMLMAEVHDLEILGAAQLFPAVSAACAVLARSAQVCAPCALESA